MATEDTAKYGRRIKGEHREQMKSGVREMYENGKSMADIGAYYQISYATVRNLLTEQDVKLRPQGRYKKK